MTKLRSGNDVAKWLVSKTSGFLDARFSRRSFIARTTLVGTAVAASGCAVITQPGSPYTYVTDCPPGALCRDGYTEFCCVINKGVNACPPDTAAAGWWRADYSVYCNGTRYYIDCNNWSGAGPCRCADGCGTRKTYCNHFRYGQCNAWIAGTGVIACRMVVCVPPYQLNIGCSPSGAVDNTTANHNADCARYTPAPLVAAPVLATVGGAVSAAPGKVMVVVRGSDGAVWHRDFDGSAWSPAWQSLGGTVSSNLAVVSPATGEVELAVRASDGSVAHQRFAGGAWPGWESLGGSTTSDIALGVDGASVHLVVRGVDHAMYTGQIDGASWSGWQSLGGVGTSDPAMMTGPSSLAFFVRGGDGEVAQRVYAGGWSPWISLGGLATSDPGATAALTQGHVFVRGPGNGLYTKRGTVGGSLNGSWESLDGNCTSDPVAVAEGSEVSVFVRGTDQMLWHRRWNGSWKPWESLGLQVRSNPAAVADGSGLWVFVQGTDNRVWYLRRSGGVWTAPASLTGLAIAPVRGAG